MSTPLLVSTEREGAVLQFRLARPKANIIDAEMVAALKSAIADHGSAPWLKAILLAAEGPHFSFGASVEEHLPDNCAAMLRGFHSLILSLLGCDTPIIAAVRGQCLGGGLELAMTADLIFAAPDARFGQPEIRLGVIAPAASCLLPEIVGSVSAQDLLLSGRSIDSAEAMRNGLVFAVADDPLAAALAYFDEHLAKMSATALRFARRAVRFDMVDRVREKLARIEEIYLNDLMATHDAVEGLRSFIEKRPANWENR